MEFLHNLNNRVAGLLLVLAGASLVAMTALTTLNVVMRVVAVSIFGTVEVVGWLAVGVNGLALAYSQQHKEHVAITLFTDRLPQIWQRRLDALGFLTGAGFAAVASWGLWLLITEMIRSGQLSTSLSIVYWPVVGALLIGVLGLLLMLIEDFAVAVRDIRLLRAGVTPIRPDHP